ncbi:MAG: MBL fold metallo-hydrolase [Bacillota bacterium]
MNLEISVLGSGSSGNSIYINNGQISILIDAGMSGKEINRRLKKCDTSVEKIDAILLTHEHNDHILGAGVLSRKCDIPVYANELTWDAAEKNLGKIKKGNCRIIDGDFSLGQLDISCFSISHDARDPVGYTLCSQGKKIGVATDMGYMKEEVKRELQNLDFLIIESNHDYEMLTQGSYPPYLKKRIKGPQGHLSNDDTAELLPELIKHKLPHILLAHLSKDNNLPDLAYITIKNRLEEAGLKVGQDLEIDFTFRDRPTKIYSV